MKNYLHVVQVAPCYVDLSKESGGVANVIRQICLKLRQKGHSVTLICSNTELGRVVAKPLVFVSPEGIAVHVVRQHPNTLAGPARNVTQALTKIIGDSKAPVVAHVHTCFSRLTESAMGLLLKKRIPYVFSPHGKLSPNMFGNHRWAKLWWWRLLARKYVSAATFIGILAESEKALFRELGLKNRTKIIPNGFSRIFMENELGVDLPPKYILFLGYIDPRKQPDFLVKAFSISTASRSHKLLFVGPDNYNFGEVVRTAARNLNVQGKVMLIGPAYGARKWKILSHAACLCLPSLGEGHPIVLCEALGAGIPSIYSTHCNFPEVSRNNAGIELDDFSDQAWADAIDRVVLNIDLREEMASSALRLSSSYTWDTAVDKWESLYFECLRETQIIERSIL